MTDPRVEYEVARDEMLFVMLTLISAKLDELTSLISGEQINANEAHYAAGQIAHEIQTTIATNLNGARSRYRNNKPGGDSV